MTIKLRQSTASQEVPLGYFVDSTDGNTEETALSIANTDIKLWKMGATTLANKNSGGATHISNGVYYAVLDATDTDTLGALVVFVHVAGALPVRVECEVLSAVVYDSLVAGTDNLQVDTIQISGDATAADNLELAFDDTAGAVPWLGIIDQGTAQAATGTTLQLRAGAAFANDEIIGAIIEITGGSAGVGQTRQITDYVSATDTATVDTWTTTPTGTITYKVFASPPAPTAAPDVNVVSISGDVTAADNLEAACDGTGYNIGGGSVVAASVTGNVGGNVTGSVGTVNALAANVITAAATAADFTTEIQAGLATASALSTVAGYIDTEVALILSAVDTEVAAVKAVTDKLDGMLEGDNQSGNTYQFTATALAEAPSGSGPTAAQIADAVWDEDITGHLTASTTGAALNAAGSAGDPWSTPLPGAYGAGTAGNIIGNNLDAAVSTRASQSSLNTLDDYVDTEVAAVKAVTDKLDGMLEGDNQSGNTYQFTATALAEAPTGGAGLDAAGVRAAIGLASANLDTQLADLPTNAELSTALGSADDAVLAVLGSPAGASLAADIAAVKAQTAAVETDTQDIQGRLPAALVGGRIDASVGAMAANALTASALAADAVSEIQSGLATSAALATVDTVVDAILVDTAEIGTAGAGLTALASASNLATLTGYVDTEVAAILSTVDTEVAAIKAKTDGLTFTVAGQVDANVQSINDVAITGNGQVGTEFGV